MSATVVLLDRAHDESAVASSNPLDLRNIDRGAFDRICHVCRTSSLRLYHLTVPTLEGIERLGSVRSLCLDWAPKVQSLAPVFRMHAVEELTIVDLPKVSTLDGIGAMQALSSLQLAGGVWKPLRLQSIRPLLALSGLRRLVLENIRLGDDDISCLASVRGLSHLELSNQFKREQVAAVARALNHQLASPLVASRESGLPCKRCGASTHMFIGRRMPFLCATCDASEFARLTREFAAMSGAA